MAALKTAQLRLAAGKSFLRAANPITDQLPLLVECVAFASEPKSSLSRGPILRSGNISLAALITAAALGMPYTAQVLWSCAIV